MKRTKDGALHERATVGELACGQEPISVGVERRKRRGEIAMREAQLDVDPIACEKILAAREADLMRMRVARREEEPAEQERARPRAAPTGVHDH